MIKWHRDAFLRWSQFCVIPAHMQTTSNHATDGFKETERAAYIRLPPALRCVSILGGRWEAGKAWGGGGVWWKLPKVTPERGHDQNYNAHGPLTSPTVFSFNVQLRQASTWASNDLTRTVGPALVLCRSPWSWTGSETCPTFGRI